MQSTTNALKIMSSWGMIWAGENSWRELNTVSPWRTAQAKAPYAEQTELDLVHQKNPASWEPGFSLKFRSFSAMGHAGTSWDSTSTGWWWQCLWSLTVPGRTAVVGAFIEKWGTWHARPSQQVSLPPLPTSHLRWALLDAPQGPLELHVMDWTADLLSPANVSNNEMGSRSTAQERTCFVF